ncbi:MAG: carboxypeptidase-like regulatory domain-containing protein [Pirellulales bacterium]
MLGCKGSSRAATYPVRGTITYHGQPLAGAAVTFMADGAARAATGKTDEAGTFQLTTFEPNDGAVPGTHVVTVKKYDSDPPPLPAAPANGAADPASEARYTAAMARWQETAKIAVPQKYTNQRTSDLHREVVAGENVFEIQLVD